MSPDVLIMELCQIGTPSSQSREGDSFARGGSIQTCLSTTQDMSCDSPESRKDVLGLLGKEQVPWLLEVNEE